MSRTHFLPGAQSALWPIGSVILSKEASASVPKLVEEPKGLSYSHQQKREDNIRKCIGANLKTVLLPPSFENPQ